MPTACTLTLRGERPARARPEDLHRLACQLVEAPGNPGHRDQVKPFSVGLVRPSDVRPDELEVCVNWLPAAEPAPASLTGAAGRHVRFAGSALEVVALRKDTRSYAELRRLPPLWACEFTFLSPAYFSRSGRDYPLPDPELLVLRLAERWNAYTSASPDLAIAGDALADLRNRVILSLHDIHTVRVEGEGGRATAGFVGHARFGLRRADRRDPAGVTSARLFAALCAFAPYAGIGAQTTHGFGAVRTTPVAR